MTTRNCDADTVDRFSKQWLLFDQSALPSAELKELFSAYFREFPWHALGPGSVGIDIGCGTGRWARYVAPRVGTLHCVDASASAVEVARRNLASNPNCVFHVRSLEDLPIPDGSMDFAYCLGVLHYIPEPAAGLRACTRKLKPGAPFLLYVYYALDGRPLWFRAIWTVADRLRRLVAATPFRIRYLLSQLIAAGIYYPLARAARIAESLGMNASNFPLSAYRRRSFYTMRTDSLDRFGNRIEHRFSKLAVLQMMEDAGLERIHISDGPARWLAIGYKLGVFADSVPHG